MKLIELSDFLLYLLKELSMNESEMLFVEYDDEVLNKELKIHPSLLADLQDEVKRLDLSEYIKFDEDDCFITIYGGILERIQQI